MLVEIKHSKLRIIADCYTTAFVYAQKQGVKDWVFVDDVKKLSGLAHSTQVTTVGNWARRSDYMRLRTEMRLRGLEIVVGRTDKLVYPQAQVG